MTELPRVATPVWLLLRGTRKFSVLSRATLRDAALSVLNEGDVERKANKTILYVKAWQCGAICDVTDIVSCDLPCPSEPKRPVSNDQMLPLRRGLTAEVEAAAETKKLKSMYKKNTVECTIHAIANAESYAVDLFWDLIARYSVPVRTNPDSTIDSTHVILPRTFYDNMTYIANQEAEHFLAWYHRLEELGYPFGTFPLSKGLWQSAGDTSGNLLARLAIINLTHEAKGLDSYAYTKEKFITAKDTISLAILDHNFKEEIFHVASGLKWFIYVCQEHGLEPIEQFHSLSRQYFKGKLKPPFNVEARETAGLSADWYMPLT